MGLCKTKLRVFAQDSAGSAMMLIALSLVVLVGASGVAIDTARVHNVKEQLQAAVDHAVIAGALAPEENITAEAENLFYANFPNGRAGSQNTAITVTYDPTASTVLVEATTEVPSTLSSIVTRRQKSIVAAEALAGRAGVVGNLPDNTEIALVLDVTTSMMQDNRLQSMKLAAEEFVEYVNSVNDSVLFSFVPFGPNVSVLPHATTWDWILPREQIKLWQMANPVVYNETQNRANDIPWHGNFRVRLGHDTLDTPPTDVLFRPYSGNEASADHSTLLRFRAGNLPPNYDVSVFYNSLAMLDDGIIQTALGAPAEFSHLFHSSSERANRRTSGGGRGGNKATGSGWGGAYCQSYFGADGKWHRNTIGVTDNRCSSLFDMGHGLAVWTHHGSFTPTRGDVINPLTRDHRHIIQRIQNLHDNGHGGGTIMNIGLVWGWRTLSPRWQGLWPESAPNLPSSQNNKIMVFLSDGKNEIPCGGPYGLAPRMGECENTLATWSRYNDYFPKSLYDWSGSGIDADTFEDAEKILDQKTLEVCNNIKNAGITLYTIALSIEDENANNLLRDCATSPDHHFYRVDAWTVKEVEDQLKTVFQNISLTISGSDKQSVRLLK